jgi:hypothetical protein
VAPAEFIAALHPCDDSMKEEDAAIKDGLGRDRDPQDD